MNGDSAGRRGANASEQALFDYFDDLLGAGEPVRTEPAHAPDTRLETARPRPQAPAARPFAEPARTLNLRMPLPPLAPTPVIEETREPEPPAVVAVPPVPSAPVSAATAKPELVNAVAIAAQPETEAAASVAAPMREATAFVAAETAKPELAAPVLETAVVAAQPEAEPIGRESAPPSWGENGQPQWAQQPFECLLFRVGGLALAVPLVELGSIYQLADRELSPIFGQAPWFMGLLPVKEHNVRVVDSARVVMPERWDESMRDQYRYVLTLNGSDWGLAVDSLINSIRLDPQQVRWRSVRSQRPWLAGTVVAQMCALLDCAQLVWLFNNQDRRRRGNIHG